MAGSEHPDSTTTGSADQSEHCSNKGYPCDPAQSRDKANKLGCFLLGIDSELAKDPKIASKTINARVETIDTTHRLIDKRLKTTVLKSSRRSNYIPVYSLIHELSPRFDEKRILIAKRFAMTRRLSANLRSRQCLTDFATPQYWPEGRDFARFAISPGSLEKGDRKLGKPW